MSLKKKKKTREEERKEGETRENIQEKKVIPSTTRLYLAVLICSFYGALDIFKLVASSLLIAVK